MGGGEEEEGAAAYNRAMQLVAAFTVPMTLKAVVELQVLEIIDRAGLGAPLSAAKIASMTPATNPQAAAAVLDRMLSYLASHSVLTYSEAPDGNGGVERRYGLAPVSKLFLENKEGGSLAAWLSMCLDKVSLDSWQELKYAVLDGTIPFKKAHGLSVFDYSVTDHRFNEVFNKSMSGQSTLVLLEILETYTGFRGIGKLVDVGGGIGTSIAMIVSKFPGMKGVNFDLPHVISNAPPLSGVEHVGGDMFANVPTGDAIFMKAVLHDWSDEHCLKLLKNCLEALPNNNSGKVIVVDTILAESPDTSVPSQLGLFADVAMLSCNVGGKERTKKELESLAKESGFSHFNVACCVYNLSVMELFK